MSTDGEIARQLRAFGSLDLETYSGLPAEVCLDHLREAFGPTDEGVAGRLGIHTLWFRVFPLPPRDRLTVWLANSESDQPIVLERPGETWLRDWLRQREHALYHPARGGRMDVILEQGFAALYNRRSRFPTLVYGFRPTDAEGFEAGPLADLG